MRAKRSKAYKKLMSQYSQTFGFREPYQVLVDSQIVKDATQFSMGLADGLERTLRGTVKPMITQCSIRHLYALDGKEIPKKNAIIDIAKTFERRRCDHHELEEPLSEKECLESVVIKNGVNKHRYVVATQSPDIRAMLRNVPGVPLVYIKRSVMIMEPISQTSAVTREREERQKFKLGIRDPRESTSKKRKREEERESDDQEQEEGDSEDANTNKAEEKPKKKKKGPKGPNPLSVKKKKPKPGSAGSEKPSQVHRPDVANADTEGGRKKRRRRKPREDGIARSSGAAAASEAESTKVGK